MLALPFMVRRKLFLNILLVEQNFTTTRNSGNNLLTYCKAFFVRHSSEHKMSDNDRKVDRNIFPDAVTRDGIRVLKSLREDKKSSFFHWAIQVHNGE